MKRSINDHTNTNSREKKLCRNHCTGTYTVNADYGSTWYGTTESFGPNGSYCTLLNGSSIDFTLNSGACSLQLLASTNGNVGSKSRSWKG